MRSRLIGLALLAYPRDVRTREGAHLAGLALDLADDHGTAREVFGLVRGGVAERWRGRGARRVTLPVVAALTLVLTALAWTANAHGGRVEEDVLSCVQRCGETEAEVGSRVRDGWTCTEHRQPAAVTWRCTLG
ncbi:MAG TPA: hypothetical protein VD864_08475 [Nocardioides sp.]|nr:hypothetical protein [Nocardioides sp.]